MAYYPIFKSGRYSGRGDDAEKLVYGRGPFGFWPALPIGMQKYSHYISACSYTAADWTETKTNSGSIAMVAAGLALANGVTDTNNTTAQMLRGFTVAAGKHATAMFRITLANVAIQKAAFGFYLTGAAPIGIIPVSGAWFQKSTTATGVITGITTAASADQTSATLATMTNGVAWDFCVTINGTTNAQFWAKTAAAEDWGTPTTHTTKVAAGAMRFSLNTTAANSGGAATLLVPMMAVAWEE